MRQLLSVLLLAVSVALVVPAPAGAGGPTSVMVTDPASGRATALYYTDPRYESLDALVAGVETLEGEPPGVGGRALNLTWLVHDVQPWRTQQLYPDAEGGPVLVTYGTDLVGDADQVTWSRIADRRGLATLLDRILRPASTSAAAAEVATPPASEPVAIERTVTETAWYSLTGWRWLVPGFLLGAGLALLAARRRTEGPEQRQVLAEVAPDDQITARR